MTIDTSAKEYPGYATAIVDGDGRIIWCTRDNPDSIAFLEIGKSIYDVIPSFTPKNGEYILRIGNTQYAVQSSPLDTTHTVITCIKSVVGKTGDGESVIHESEFLKLLLDSKYEGFVFLDCDGTILYSNNMMNKYSKTNLVGVHFNKYEIDPYMMDILKTEQTEFFRHMHNGKKNYIASRRPVYHNDTLIGAFGHYLSIDSYDANNVFDKSYSNIISKLQIDELSSTLKQTIAELENYKDEFYRYNRTRFGVNKILGVSPSAKRIKQKIINIRNSPSPVLITGETGTGKELIANAIHYHSIRSKYPFIKVNCAAIPENLFESELFGYVEGAFTGAKKGGKIGKFELADKGVIFLDEIGDMPLSMQVKLLRVLQEKEIERVGSETTKQIDVRIVSATNKNLLELIRQGKFREDLYYRINVLHIESPALRDRKEDIPVIVMHKVKEFNKILHTSITHVSDDAMDKLCAYAWPGNVRELYNVIESAMNYCKYDYIDVNAFPAQFGSASTPYEGESAGNSKPQGSILREVIYNTEKDQIVTALEANKYNRKKTAEMLTISKSTLYRLMKKHDLLQ